MNSHMTEAGKGSPQPYGGIESIALSDVGRRRVRNEDVAWAFNEALVYGVADGVGGAEGGEMASQALRDRIAEAVRSKEFLNMSLFERVDRIREVVASTGEWLRRSSEERGICGMATTLVLLLADPEGGHRAIALHAGDSRLYRFRNSTLLQLTRDHSAEAAAESAGFSPRNLPASFRGIVTRAIGLGTTVSLEQTDVDLERNDVLLLCSDGLTKMVNDCGIESILRECSTSDLSQVARRMISEANAAGGLDNISLVLIRFPFVKKLPLSLPTAKIRHFARWIRFSVPIHALATLIVVPVCIWVIGRRMEMSKWKDREDGSRVANSDSRFSSDTVERGRAVWGMRDAKTGVSVAEAGEERGHDSMQKGGAHAQNEGAHSRKTEIVSTVGVRDSRSLLSDGRRSLANDADAREPPGPDVNSISMKSPPPSVIKEPIVMQSVSKVSNVQHDYCEARRPGISSDDCLSVYSGPLGAESGLPDTPDPASLPRGVHSKNGPGGGPGPPAQYSSGTTTTIEEWRRRATDAASRAASDGSWGNLLQVVAASGRTLRELLPDEEDCEAAEKWMEVWQRARMILDSGQDPWTDLLPKRRDLIVPFDSLRMHFWLDRRSPDAYCAFLRHYHLKLVDSCQLYISQAVQRQTDIFSRMTDGVIHNVALLIEAPSEAQNLSELVQHVIRRIEAVEGFRAELYRKRPIEKADAYPLPQIRRLRDAQCELYERLGKALAAPIVMRHLSYWNADAETRGSVHGLLVSDAFSMPCDAPSDEGWKCRILVMEKLDQIVRNRLDGR